MKKQFSKKDLEMARERNAQRVVKELDYSKKDTVKFVSPGDRLTTLYNKRVVSLIKKYKK